MEGEEKALPLPVPPDELRCNRTDGRFWRCKKPAIPGKYHCHTHLYRSSSSSSNGKKTPKIQVNYVSTPDDISPMSTRLRRRVKPEPFDDVDPLVGFPPDIVSSSVSVTVACVGVDSGAAMARDSVMVAREEVSLGDDVARDSVTVAREEVSLGDEVARDSVVVSREEGELGLEKRGEFVRLDGEVVPDEVRCNKTDGRQWRCKRMVVEGKKFCQVHLSMMKVVKSPRVKKKADDVEGEVECGRVVDEVAGKRVPRKKNPGFDYDVVEKEKEKSKTKSKSKMKDKFVIEEGLPDELRCTRNDGREWRCKRRVVEGEILCEAHFKGIKLINVQSKEMGNLSKKRKKVAVKEEVELEEDGNQLQMVADVAVAEAERIEGGGEKGGEDEWRCKRTDGRGWRCKRMVTNGTMCELHYEQAKLRQKKINVPESLKIQRGEGGERFERKMKRKRALEILENNSDIGMKRMKGELIRVFLRREIIEQNKKNEKGVVSNSHSGEITRDLPYGLMAIPPATPSQIFENVESLGIKVGVNCSNSLVKRRFRSKNIEPLPVGPLKVVPFAENVKNGGMRKCHWCQSSDFSSLTKWSSCRKMFFCAKCIKDRDCNPEEIEVKCLVCQGNCDCKACCTTQTEDEIMMGSKFQQLQYLIKLLLPILELMNQDQNVETETEARFKEKDVSEVEIRQADEGCRNHCCCNNCKSSILNFHRSCPNCSYNLCLSCCRASTCGLQISCPPMELGGCDNSLLDLKSIFPLNWTKDLENTAKETISGYNLDPPQPTDDSSNGSLYCPSTSDDHFNVLNQFQKHWFKGHPVKFRNVLQNQSTLDPLTAFCSCLEDRNNCEDWFEVEIGTKEIFTQSLKEGCIDRQHKTLRVQAKIALSFSKGLIEKEHFSEIIDALPLQEYTNPKSGLLNIAGKLNEDVIESKLGPHVCISFGTREIVARGELVTKLHYNTYDMVNILTHVADATCSMEQLNKVSSLVRKRKTENTQTLENADPTNHNEMDNGIVAKRKTENAQTLENSDATNHNEMDNGIVGAGNERVVEGSDVGNGVVDASCCLHVTETTPGSLPDVKTTAELNCSDVNDTSVYESTDDGSHIVCWESSKLSDKRLSDPCGARWDVFRRQDIPKLIEYIKKHAEELSFSCYFPENVVHSMFDGSFYLDSTHKIQLKEEFDIEPWTFNQCLGEAVFIPAGCPYQIKNVKSCINISVGFISPENASECIKLINEIRTLPNNHKEKEGALEVEKMAIYNIDEAIKEISRLRSEELDIGVQQPVPNS